MFKQVNYLGGKAMTDNAYFDLLREELNGIYEKYDNSYESLEQNVKANTANKKYFSGSFKENSRGHFRPRLFCCLSNILSFGNKLYL